MKLLRNLEVLLLFTVFWVVMNEGFTPIIVGSGLLLSVLVLWLTNILDHADYANDLFRSPVVVVRYLAFVIKEMILAAVAMAKVIITGRGNVVEAQYRSTLYDERKLFLLATAITMTPGSITVFRRGGDLMVLSVGDNVASVEASCEHLETRIAEITK